MKVTTSSGHKPRNVWLRPIRAAKSVSKKCNPEFHMIEKIEQAGARTRICDSAEQQKAPGNP